MPVLARGKPRDQALNRMLGNHAGPVRGVAFSPTEPLGLSGGGDGSVRV